MLQKSAKLIALVCLGGLLGASAHRVWGPMPHFHGHGMNSVGESEIAIEVPRPDQRDPDKCELFESVDYMEQGCEQHCSVNGFFGSIRIQDAQPRRVATCKEQGSYCRVPLITHSEMNVTYTNGRCNADCQCEPHRDNDEEIVQGVRKVVGALLSSRHHSAGASRRHRLHSGANAFGALQLRVPAASERNQTACEDYEVNYFAMGGPAHMQCQDVCTLSGNIGGLQFEGAPRALATPKTDGSYCELHSEHGQGHLELRGVQQIVTGECHKGVCKPLGWKDPTAAKQEETKPLLTLSPSLDAVSFRGHHSRASKKTAAADEAVSTNSIATKTSASSSSSSSSEEI